MINHYSEIAGVLLVLSGFTHIAQFKFYPKDKLMAGAIAYGVIYLLTGLLILLGKYYALFLGIFLPALGLTGGLYRYFKAQKINLILFHIAVDLLVIIFSLLEVSNSL